ncbi:hypothetical protein B0920_14715 [Massilia sp. KIM]|uniref:recombinase family protein n=1 Tax=Massilia sp. KIM TaxID=1955422 RepID=UPI0009CD3975|nr:recombinase family protein [Massilia sp. KIM]OON64523.1 hypothetical protein B0920_14715 [Massilia sp. KIM]
MPVAYSYIRFSTPEQSKGDSHRRQLDKSKQYALSHGLTLDDTLSFNDLGKSAFRGDHAKTGGLSLFIAAIDSGIVEEGSYLLIENLDRLSRQPAVDALALLQSIVSRGVTVVTLADGREYTKESLRSDPASLLVSIIVMFRAHEESKVKGERLRSAWTKKKQVDARGGKPITAMTPRWLRVVGGQFEVIEERAAVIRRVFDLATKEGLGQRAICTVMNREGHPTASGSGKKWTETAVRRILLNPAVMGRYQPYSHDPSDPRKRVEQGEPIENYYPVIVERAQYLDAQRLRKDALLPRGPRATTGANTIFTGLVICGKCGSPMVRKGASKFDPTPRLRCKMTCGMQSWKAPPLEMAVKNVLASDLLPHVKLKDSDRKRLQGRVTEAKAALALARTSVANLLRAVEAGTEFSPALQMALRDAESRELKASQELANAEHELSAVELKNATRLDHVDAVQSLVSAMQDGDKGQMLDRLRYALSRSIDRIVLDDTDTHRIVRLEAGNQARIIEFSRSDLTFRLRVGEKSLMVGAAMRESDSGEATRWIP